jgi:hypothetical protein
MNSRERVLALSLLFAVVVLGGWALFHVFYKVPMENATRRLETAAKDVKDKEDALEKERADMERILDLDPRLGQWRKISLPEAKKIKLEDLKREGRTQEEVRRVHLGQLQVNYEAYLHNLLRRHSFNPATISVNPKPPDNKGVPTLAKGGAPIYNRFAFTVQGQTTLAHLVEMLEDFYRTPVLHEVRSLSILKPQTVRQGANRGDLEINMTVEALQVTGAEERDAASLIPDSLTAKPVVLSPMARLYPEMAAKSMFDGTAANSRLTEDPKDVLSFVKLTSLTNNGRRWEAALYDQGKGGDEKYLTERGRNEFTVLDKYENVLLQGTVVYVDQRVMIFKANDKHYQAFIGDVLYDALANPFDPPTVKEPKEEKKK